MSIDERPTPALNAILRDLTELALDLRWSWNHAADDLWSSVDPVLWELTHNPWGMLQTVSQKKLQQLAEEKKFCALVGGLLRENREAATASAWFQETYPNSSLTTVAYFSLEFMLSEALPIYSGGLGNVAGDQLKAASDLGVPVVGVGLLYQQGYFRQEIDSSGAQQALYPFNDPGQLPISPVRDLNGEWVRFSIAVPGSDLWLRAWEARVGRNKIYLLDSNDPANLPHNRGITAELYGGGPELRVRQEQVLGIGGWRLLQLLGLQPEVCHLNEGHAAFAVLERARCHMKEHGQPFDVSLMITRAGNVFTTHTPVEAGFDRFAPGLIEQYFQRYAEEELEISMGQFLALGRRNSEDSSEPFNMAYLAMRGSGIVNGVSKLHGEVSRRIFQPLFQGWPRVEVPVGHVTNGVHVPTWDSLWADRLWTSVCGKERWRGDLITVGPEVRRAPEDEVWEMRAQQRKCLVECVRKRLARQLAGQGASLEDVAGAGLVFDFNTLTLCIARRFATYKRPTLLLRDPDRLARLLTDPLRPVQLVVAGKAHPLDFEGQAMIKDWTDFARRPDVRSRVIFLSDYDMLLTEILVQGADVWINTPRRPWEACGTSGMKVLVNGGLNLSELDGWWAEAYSPEVGWAIGNGLEHGDDPFWDGGEAEELYRLLEAHVVPEFYNRDGRGIPTVWVARMRESMARLTPLFSSNRTVREYVERYYLPAVDAYHRRSKENGSLGGGILEWRQHLDQHWDGLRFGLLTVEETNGKLTFDVQVFLDEIDPDAVRIELFADGQAGSGPVREPMSRGPALVGSANSFAYSTSLMTDRPPGDFTPRLLPYHAEAFIPMESSKILWQR